MAVGGRKGLPAVIRYGSVCSGIEAATVAWHGLGWVPAWYSEIEAFPCAVLKHHYPAVPNYGDMTKFEEWPDEPIELLVGGTPCQSFSVAGLRKGLADPRGNLMLTFGAIARKYRPEWLVWENVPGVLSSNGGRDFGTFLGMLAELGYGFAYRVLDAQYFGVAQRRRRVFVVANARGWQRAAAVLFERESLSGHPAPSREKGEGVAGTIAARFGNSRNNHEELAWPAEVASTLTAKFGSKLGLENQHALGGAPLFVPDVLGTLTARMMNALGARDIEDGAVLPCAFHNRQDPDVSGDITHPVGAKDNGLAVAQPIAFSAKDHGADASTDLSPTLRAMPHNESHANGGGQMAVAQPITQFGDVAGSLTARHDSSPCADRGQNVVAQPMAFEPGSIARNAGPVGESPLAPTLRREMGDNQPAVRIDMQARRLTPVECERLQGFLDNYTNIPWRKKSDAPDGPRYKALGNSMAVPVMQWIGERIAAVESIDDEKKAP
jgi:DNA (cytosine-5)-methyltransferase 1